MCVYEMGCALLFLIILCAYHLNFSYGCEDGGVHLLNDYKNSSGQVQFCHEGNWRNVCYDDLSEVEARVICRELDLPTDVTVVFPHIGMEDMEDSIHFNSIMCSGNESRLQDCEHRGIRVHSCGKTRSAGVSCLPYDNPPAVCGSENSYLSEITREDIERYGNCLPYQSIRACNSLRSPGVDYVYLSYHRAGGDLSRYTRFFANSADFFIGQAPEQCVDLASKIFCHVFFPTCGNGTEFNPPAALCQETCEYVQSLCPSEWDQVAQYFERERPLGTNFINCNATGDYLEPLPHCCTNAGIVIPNNTRNITRNSTSSNGEPTNKVAIVSSVLVTATLLLLVGIGVGVCIYSCRKRYVANTKSRRMQEVQHTKMEIPPPIPAIRYQQEIVLRGCPQPSSRLARVCSGYIRQVTEEKLLIPGRCIHTLDCIGQGEFGVVYRGNLSGWREQEQVVAVKTLKGRFSTNDLDNLVSEGLKMAKFNHPNVMKLIGVCIDSGDIPCVVMPFMTHGSLLSYLRKHRADLTIAKEDNMELVNFAQKKLLSICLQIAKGMAYLANEKFVHRDLAARNCMIDHDLVIKVSDFGLTEDVYSRNYFRQKNYEDMEEGQVKLPLRWMALESLTDGIFTEKTDVWSFGVTCWEVFSLGKSPYPGVEPYSLVRLLEGGQRLGKPANAACSMKIFDVVEQCWITVPDERPAFSELVNKLSVDLGAIAGYLELSAALVSCKEEQNTAEHDRHKELNEVPCVQNLTAAVDSNINPATLGTQ